MLSVKTERGSPASPALFNSTGVQTDLDLWNHHLASSLDMDKKSDHLSQRSSRQGRGERPNGALGTPPAQAHAAPASSAAAAQSHTGLVPGWHPHPPSAPANPPGNVEEVARALRTIQDAYPILVQSMAYHQQTVPRDPNRFPPAVPPQVTSQPPWTLNQPGTSQGGAMPNYTPGFGELGFPAGTYSAPNAHYPTSQCTPIIGASGESSFQGFTSTQTQESGSVDGDALSDEKRRRNTAASARFRIKKKVKTHNLERTVSDLSGRVGELEQEAAGLRRENGWLKEIVVLKSGTARGGNSLAGPSQARSQDTQLDEEESEEGGSGDGDDDRER